jgi:gliding motility-associated-like protein
MKSTLSAFSSLIIIIGLLFGTNSIVNAQQGDIIVTACATATYTLSSGTSIHFYDDGGPGGDCANGGSVANGNYANSGCETITTICPAPGETLNVDFIVLSMFATPSGFDWMVIYEGPTTTGNILFDNRSGGPDNPNATSCTYDNSAQFCITDNCFTFRFYASSVVNKEGWDALVSSTPTLGPGSIDIDVTDPTCTTDGSAELLNYDNTLTYVFTPAGPTIGPLGEIVGANFGQNYSIEILNGACGVEATFQIKAQFITPDAPDFVITAPTCLADGSAEINNYLTGATYTFTPAGPSVGGAGVVTGATFGQNYSVEVDNGNCTATATFQVEEQFDTPIPDFFGDLLEGCSPHTVTFIDTSGFVNATCTWDFGDGNTSNLCDTVSHIYTGGGIYDVTLTMESEFGCIGDTTLINYIEVADDPIADFTADPMMSDYTDTEVNFTNESTNATSYIWDFGDLSPQVNDVDPVHEFPNGVANNYTVTLYAMGDLGCVDTATLVIIIKNPDLDFSIPNVFTPNGDNENDFFQMVNVENIPELEIVILNRWGNLVFESGEVNFKWNGLIQNNGAECSDGTYFYKVILKDLNGKEITEHGFVQLSRGK